MKSAKPATGQELSDFMAEMRILMAGTNQRVDSLEKQIEQSHGESRAANTVVDNVVPHQNNGILGEFVSPVNLPDSRDMLNASTVMSSNSAQRNNNASPTRNAEAFKLGNLQCSWIILLRMINWFTSRIMFLMETIYIAAEQSALLSETHTL